MYVILGAGSGLGKTLAMHLSEGDHILVLAGRTLQPLNRTKELIEQKKRDVKVVIETVDLTKSNTITEFVNRLNNYQRRLRAFVNTAAGFYKGSFDQQTLESIDALLNANYCGVVQLIARLVKHAKREVPLDIINITSISSATTFDTSRSSSLHIATKAAAHIFGKVLGRELAHDGIRITSIAPGTFSRKGSLGIPEYVIVDLVKFLLALPSEAWIESVDVRPTFMRHP